METDGGNAVLSGSEFLGKNLIFLHAFTDFTGPVNQELTHSLFCTLTFPQIHSFNDSFIYSAVIK